MVLVLLVVVVVVGNETTSSKSRLSFKNTMGETCEHPTTRRGGREWESDPDSDPEVPVRSTASRVCRFRVWCLHATAATATPPLIGAKPLNSKKIAFHPVFSFQDDGKFMAESSSVFQTSLPGGRCTREALGRTGEGPCERSIQNTARLVRTRFRIGKKREEVDTFLRPGKGGQGNACKGWDHYDMILNTARVVVTHRSLR